jgi:hypothetical protein
MAARVNPPNDLSAVEAAWLIGRRAGRFVSPSAVAAAARRAGVTLSPETVEGMATLYAATGYYFARGFRQDGGDAA